jgi:hypothetical protein
MTLSPSQRWDKAYWAARDYFRENPLAVGEQVAELAAKQDPIALELLEAMIDPQPVTP